MKTALKIVGHLLILAVLTVTTQIGGIIYGLSWWLHKKWRVKPRFKLLLVFTALYLTATLVIIPLAAPFFGREKITHSDKIRPANYMTVLLNRNYVRPELNTLLAEVENALKGTNIKINYLDANFPFINGFPLLPHLSHDDGEKIDISLIYETKNGEISYRQKSVSGYGVFEGAMAHEADQVKKCLSSGYFLYDFPKYLTFGMTNKELVFSKKGTKKLIEGLLSSNHLGKLFIEPHLKQRLNLTDARVRYHGCQAVRHDDHIHVQLP